MSKPKRDLDRAVSAHDQLVVASFGTQSDRLETSPHLRADEPLRWFLQALSIAGTERVLDLGCGTGILSLELARHCGSVFGLDLTPALIERARGAAAEQKFSNVEFAVGDARHLQWPDQCFDVVATRLALHHMPEPERAIAEAARVLRRGGTLAIFDMTTSENASEARVHNRFETYRDPSHARSLPVSELFAHVGASGLEPIALHTRLHEFELEDYIARVDQSAAEAASVRSMAIEHAGTPTYLGRRLRHDHSGSYSYSHRWCIAIAIKPEVGEHI